LVRIQDPRNTENYTDAFCICELQGLTYNSKPYSTLTTIRPTRPRRSRRFGAFCTTHDHHQKRHWRSRIRELRRKPRTCMGQRGCRHSELRGNRAHVDGRMEFHEWSASLHIINERYTDFTVWHLNVHAIEETTLEPPRMALWHFRGKGLSFRVLRIVQESYRPFIS
jgi:hypothetical protein